MRHYKGVPEGRTSIGACQCGNLEQLFPIPLIQSYRRHFELYAGKTIHATERAWSARLPVAAVFVPSRPLVLCIYVLLDEQRAGRASTAPLVLRLSRSTTGQTAFLYCLWLCQRPWTCTAARRRCWHKLNLSVCSRPHSATYHVCAKPPLPSLVSQEAVVGRGATGAAVNLQVGNMARKPTHWLRPTRLLWLRPAYRMCGCDFHHLWCFTPLMTRRQAVLTK